MVHVAEEEKSVEVFEQENFVFFFIFNVTFDGILGRDYLRCDT